MCVCEFIMPPCFGVNMQMKFSPYLRDKRASRFPIPMSMEHDVGVQRLFSELSS